MQVCSDARSRVSPAAVRIDNVVDGVTEVVPACRAWGFVRRRKPSAHARWSARVTVWRRMSGRSPVVRRVGRGGWSVTEPSFSNPEPVVGLARTSLRWTPARTGLSVSATIDPQTTATGLVPGPTVPLSTRHRREPRLEHVTPEVITWLEVVDSLPS